jgi:hypothetical protein
MVWEYYFLEGYADAVWFADETDVSIEESGLQAPNRFPVRGRDVVLCEAKSTLTHQVIGQALVYNQVALRQGANVREVVIFAESGTPLMREIAQQLGLTVVVQPLQLLAEA